jgi:succinoglycan biosynthesis protein ExoA
VSENVPSVTVLIAARPDQVDIKAVGASRAMDYPGNRIEILIARGKQPSAQRNAGMKSATGELIYFLDDDSLPQVDNLHRASSHFRDPAVQMVGGPNVCPSDAPLLEQIFARVLSSRMAFGPSRARYTSTGRVRPSSEKELILCNLVARREAMLSLGGFNEALYPNEENALMDELQKRDGKLIYDPDFLVYRRPRSTLKAFVKMLMTYGRGRAEQFRLHPTFGSVLNFVPPLFLLYLVMVIMVALAGRTWITEMLVAPLGFYAVLALAEGITLGFFHEVVGAAGDKNTAGSAGFTQRLVTGAATAPLIVLTHVLYGFGFWRGLFTRLDSARDKSSNPIKIERIK